MMYVMRPVCGSPNGALALLYCARGLNTTLCASLPRLSEGRDGAHVAEGILRE